MPDWDSYDGRIIMLTKKKQKMPYTRMLALGFALIILLGALLLCLPVSTRSREWMPFLDALFTATSATCVTGLVVADTYQNWSLFGQLVILTLIQIGGLGFITIGSYIAVILKKKIGLKEREAIHESVSTIELAGVVKLVRKIVMGTFAFELTGALLLSLRFVPQYGFWRGCYMGIFHAISAFCNAGFDLMGRNEAYSSLVAYEGDILVNLTIMALIVIGGAGFLVWDDIHRNKLNFKKYLLHTKIVLITTGVLIFGGALLFYLMEKDNVLAGMNAREQLLGSLFSSVTPRTAGFNSVDTAALKDSSKFLTMVLMFIGGSPGSTAGGVKVTTAVVMVLSTIAMVRGTHGVNILDRRLEESAVKRASAIVTIDLGLAVAAALIIMSVQPLKLSDALFEVFSAIGTVGMTTGITRELVPLSRIVIILLMYCGRLGSLTFTLVFARSKPEPPVKQPVEKIVVG